MPLPNCSMSFISYGRSKCNRNKGSGSRWTERETLPQTLQPPVKSSKATCSDSRSATGVSTPLGTVRAPLLQFLGDFISNLGGEMGAFYGHSPSQILKGTSSARDGSLSPVPLSFYFS